MRKLISLEYEHKAWSWGLVVNHLIQDLKAEYEIVSMEFDRGNWDRNREVVMRGADLKKTMILSQNASQLPKIPYLENTLARLGGNSTFADLDNPRTKQYLDLMGKCAAVIVTNKKLESVAMTAHKHVYLIPNGLDLDKWSPVKHSFTPGTLRVGFCGNISTPAKRSYKGYDIVYKVCKSMGFPLVHALYGKGQIPHDQMYERFWSKIDVLVLLTDGEGCSNTLMEATACGVPVIITKEAGLHGEVMVNEHDCLFSQKTPKDLERCLRRLSANEDLFFKLARNARAFANTYHDIKMVSNLYRLVFDKHFPQSKETKAEKAARVQESKMEIIPPKPVSPPAKPVDTSPKPTVTFVCVLKDGGDFLVDDVIRLSNSVKRNCSIPHQFVCLSDSKLIPKRIKSIPLIHNWPGWWSKIEVFRPDLFDTEYVCYLDLDTVITGSLDGLIQGNINFSGLMPWKGVERKRNAICSGLMVWQNKKFTMIYTNFTYAKHSRLFRGDQDYISNILVKHSVPHKHLQKFVKGIYSYKLDTNRKDLPSDAIIVVFHGTPRPRACLHLPWVQEHWK